MHTSNRLSSSKLKSFILAAAMLIPAGAVLGDTVYIQSTANGKPFARANVTINKIAKDKDDDFESLYFTTEGGRTEHQDLKKVVQIEADNEPAFNQAEAAFAKNDLTGAGEAYRRAMGSTTKEWLKHRADIRLLGISANTGDFLGAVTGYVELARKDPAGAAAHKPPLSSAKADQLGSAVSIVNRGIAGASVESKRTLLSYAIEIYTKMGDTTKASAALADLKLITPAQNTSVVPGVPAPDNDSANASAAMAKSAEADIALTNATTALGSHDYAKVVSSINGASASFVDPDKQARALYLLAQAKEATATTPDAWEETALAYMRVVAHFKSLPNGPAADALYKTATIEEKLNKPGEAKLIYTQVMNEYKDSKAAEDAKAAVARLSK